MGKYSCICGFTTNGINSYAGHCRHCTHYLISIGKYDEIKALDKKVSQIAQKSSQKKAENERNIKLAKWISEMHKCETCGKVMTEKFGSGKFCCRSCANKRVHSEETKIKIQQSVIKYNKTTPESKTEAKSKAYQETKRKNKEKYYQNPKFCKICKGVIPYEKRDKKTCGNEQCIKTAISIGARKGGACSVANSIKRSKNEIAFCELCENHFGINNVLHNVVMFNGWDADVILLKEKIAILWNGPWHYRKITQAHNLKQVQNRDKIKVKEIEKCGFTPYIIRDNSEKKSNIVADEFDKLLQYINDINDINS